MVKKAKKAKAGKVAKPAKAKASKVAKKTVKKPAKTSKKTGQSSAKSDAPKKVKKKHIKHSTLESDKPSLLQNDQHQCAPSIVEALQEPSVFKDVSESGVASNTALDNETSLLAGASAAVDEPKLAAVGECVDSYMDRHEGWENSDKVTKYKYTIDSIPAVLSVIKNCLKGNNPPYKLSPSTALYEKCVSDDETILQMKIDIAAATKRSA